jgi:hypothetical protein
MVMVVSSIKTSIEAEHADPGWSHHLSEFLAAAATLLCWPTSVPFGFIAYVPTIIFCMSILKAAPKLADCRWFTIAVFGWVGAQIFTIAIGRGASGNLLSSRYFDALQVGMMLNLASALSLLAMNFREARINQMFKIALIGWCLFLGVSVGFSTRSLWGQIEAKRLAAITQTDNLRSYFATGDLSYLANKSASEISFPPLEKLHNWRDDPVIRSFLSPTLVTGVAVNGAVERFKVILFALRDWVIALGVVLLILSLSIGRSWASAPLVPEVFGKSRDCVD